MKPEHTESVILEQIQSLEDEWIRCYLAQDVACFAALIDEDFVYSSERGVFRKQAYVSNLESGTIDMRGFVNTERSTVVHRDGDIAVSYGIAYLDASLDGQDISGGEQFTRIWKREGDTYVAIALHANELPDEQASDS